MKHDLGPWGAPSRLMAIGRSFALLLLLLIPLQLVATPIDRQTSERIAERYFRNEQFRRFPQGQMAEQMELELVYAPSIKVFANNKKGVASSSSEQAAFYIYNRGTADGFVIVAGDDCLPELLAYSPQGHFAKGEIPDHIAAFLDAYRRSVAYFIEHEAERTRSLELSSFGSSEPLEVAPLLGKIQWNQSYPWNYRTPLSPAGKNMPVGCVATAVTQVMRQHKWPEKGMGSYEYTEPASQRTHRVNFEETSYDWKSMPERLLLPDFASNKQRDALSLLAYHVGVAVDMNYTPKGSGSFMPNVVRALRENFRYDKSLQLLHRLFYTQTEWNKILRHELANGRSVVYAGYGGNSGHAFVCDGYDSKGYFHINWGWGGTSDGYFLINMLNPSALGIGGGSGGGFNVDQQMLVGIRPDKNGDSHEAIPIVASRSLSYRLSENGSIGCTVFVPEIFSDKKYDGSFRLQIRSEDGRELIKEGGISERISLRFLKEGEDVAVRIPSVKLSSFSSLEKGPTRYLVCVAYETSKGYLPLGHLQAVESRAILSIDASGKAELHEEGVEGRVSLVEGSFNARLFGFEKSSISFRLKNEGTDELQRELRILAKAVDRENWTPVYTSMEMIAGQSEYEVKKDIGRLLLFPNKQYDFCVQLGDDSLEGEGKAIRIPLAEKVWVTEADKVAVGIVVEYKGETTDGKIVVNENAPKIPSLKVSNVGTSKTDNLLLYIYFTYMNELGERKLVVQQQYASLQLPAKGHMEYTAVGWQKEHFQNLPEKVKKEGIQLQFVLQDVYEKKFRPLLVDVPPIVVVNEPEFQFEPAPITGPRIKLQRLSSETPLYLQAKGRTNSLWVDLNCDKQYQRGEELLYKYSIQERTVPTQYFGAGKELYVYGDMIEFSVLNSEVSYIDVTTQPELEALACPENSIDRLELEANEKLVFLDCRTNLLQELSFLHNKAMQVLLCSGNRIKDEAMTRMIRSLPDRSVQEEKPGFVFLVDKHDPKSDNYAMASDIEEGKHRGWRFFDLNGVSSDSSRKPIPYDGEHFPGSLADADFLPRIFPNPCTDVLHIEEAPANKPLRIYTADGRLVATVHTDSEGKASIDLHTAAIGEYLVQIGMITRKLTRR